MPSKKCAYCGSTSNRPGGWIFIAEVSQWFHKDECCDRAHEEYNQELQETALNPLPLKTRWFKVSETSPTKGDMPCVVALRHNTYDIATNRSGSDWWFKDAYYDGDEEPIYWMPLPPTSE